MADRDDDILADRLNNEPPIFRGLSNSELGMVMKIAAAFWIPVCLLLAFLMGKTVVGLGIAMLLILVTVVISGTVFQRLKRGRPYYFYQHKLMLRNKVNTKTKDIIQYSGTWGLGRIDDGK